MALLFDRHITKNQRLALWKVTEGLNSVPDDVQQTIVSVKSSKRHVELIGEYHLIRYLDISGQVEYLPNGKPVLKTGEISISHGKDLVGIILDPQHGGLDIQLPDPKLIRIETKFCNQSELDLIQGHKFHLELATLIWSGKESIFKVYGENMPFADGMKIDLSHLCEGEEFPSRGEFECLVNDGLRYRLMYETVEGSFVVWAHGLV